MTTAIALDALKTKHAQTWALGDYPAVARDVISSLGPIVVNAANVKAGQRVLDVAAGSGNVAIPAARTGAWVIASDLTPELLEEGRSAATAAGVSLAWEQADAEALPYATASFDTVLSCVGVMFAPHHQDAADELVRVTRPGGTIALLSWTPAGFIGQMFATMKPFQAPPPPGVQPPPLWGDPAHVTALLGDRVTVTGATTATLEVTAFDSADDFLHFFKRKYGPTIAAYRGLGDDTARINDLDEALVRLASRFSRFVDGKYVMEWEYLLLTATRK